MSRIPPCAFSRPRWARLARVAGASALLVCGCTQSKPPLLTAPEPAIVWPAAPDQPRVRYVGELRGSTDLRPKPTFAEFWDAVAHGPPAPSMLVTPYAVAVHPDGVRVAVADTGGACVHLFNLATETYERYEGAGSPPRRFESPVAVAWVGDTVWVADSRIHALCVLKPLAGHTTKTARAGTSPGPWSSDAQPRTPAPTSAPASAGWIGTNQLKRPSGLGYSATNNLVYVSDAGAHAVLAYETDGRLALQFGTHGAGEGQFNCPSQVACASDSIFVIDSLNSRVQRVALDGSPMSVFGRKGDAAGDLALPKGVAADAAGNLWIVDAQFENVQAFMPDGRLLMAFGEEGHGPGQFWLPAGACIDMRNRLWVADSYNHRVQVFQLLP